MLKTAAATMIALALAVTAFAGPTETVTLDQPVMGSEYYRTGEFQLDAFGVFTHRYGGTVSYEGCRNHRERAQRDREFKRDSESFGGGLAANYFFTENFGAAIDGYYLPENETTELAASIIARKPMGRFAPYILVGGGTVIRDHARALGKAGAGVEYKFTPNLGIKAEYTFNVLQNSGSFGAARVGLSYSF